MPPLRCHRVTALQQLVAMVGVLLALVVPGALRPSSTYAETPTPTPIPNPYEEAVGGELLDRAGVVEPEGDLPPVPPVAATSFVVANLTTRDVLAAKNAHESLAPGSALAMLLGLTVLGRVDPEAVYTLGEREVEVEGNRIGLRAGTEHTLDELLFGLFLRAGNDAAAALTAVAGGAEQIVAEMNHRASLLGAFDTEADGLLLEKPEHRSSAYDLALIAAAGLENEDFARYAGAASYTFPRTDEPTSGSGVGTGSATEPPDDGFRIESTNDLLVDYPGAFGVFADRPGAVPATIVGAAERDGQRLLVVVMRAEPPAASAAADLLDWGFTVVASAEPIGELVTPADVAERSGMSEQSESPAPSGPATGATTPPTGTGATPRSDSFLPFSPLGLDPPQLVLLALAAVFVVLAGGRVRTVVRARRAAAKAGPHSSPSH